MAEAAVKLAAIFREVTAIAEAGVGTSMMVKINAAAAAADPARVVVAVKPLGIYAILRPLFLKNCCPYAPH